MGKSDDARSPGTFEEEIERMISWINNPNTFQNTYYITGIEGSILLNLLQRKGDLSRCN